MLSLLEEMSQDPKKHEDLDLLNIAKEKFFILFSKYFYHLWD